MRIKEPCEEIITTSNHSSLVLVKTGLPMYMGPEYNGGLHTERLCSQSIPGWWRRDEFWSSAERRRRKEEEGESGEDEKG